MGKGTGLGLAICKCIMDKHGHQLRLLPSDRGSVFEFTLDMGKEPPRHIENEA